MISVNYVAFIRETCNNLCLFVFCIFCLKNKCTRQKEIHQFDGHVFQEFIVINNMLIKTWGFHSFEKIRLLFMLLSGDYKES